MRRMLALTVGFLIAACGDTGDEVGMDEGLVETDGIGVFSDWDSDANAMIDQNEWRSGYANHGLFDTYDRNDSGVLENDEWDARWGDYAGYDRDGVLGISEQEFEQGLFDSWDQNDDMMLDENEYGRGADLF